MSSLKQSFYDLAPGPYSKLAQAVKSLAIGRESVGRAYFQSNGAHLLQIGAGHSIFEGWLHGDLEFWNEVVRESRDRMTAKIYLDLARTFPFNAGVFDAVYSSHVHEHLPYAAGDFLLKECFRVLKPGARLRILMPDIDFYIAEYAKKQKGQALDEGLKSSIRDFCAQTGAPADGTTLLNHIFMDSGHRMIYDFAQLQEQLRRAGFSDVARSKPDESASPFMKGLDSSPMGRESKEIIATHLRCSLIVECAKPS